MSDTKSETGKNGASRGTMPAAVAGAGIGAVVAALVQGNPTIVAHLADWALSLVILGGLGWFMASFGPPFLRSQQEMASGMAEMNSTIRQRFAQEDDVRMAVRALAAKFDDVIRERAPAKTDQQ
jgi:hypothetical protein